MTEMSAEDLAAAIARNIDLLACATTPAEALLGRVMMSSLALTNRWQDIAVGLASAAALCLRGIAKCDCDPPHEVPGLFWIGNPLEIPDGDPSLQALRAIAAFANEDRDAAFAFIDAMESHPREDLARFMAALTRLAAVARRAML